MAERRMFLEQVKRENEAEVQWLQQLFDFVSEHLGPLPPAPASPTHSVSELCLDLIRILQENSASHCLPLSYRFISVSDLVSLQRLPCVSCLSWSTTQHRAQVHEAEQIPGLRPLPRVKLLLIGRLCRGRSSDLKFSDASGEISCQIQSSVWSLPQDQAVFLPHWNFIPQNAPGLLELMTSPLPLGSTPQQRGVRAGLSAEKAVLSVMQAKTHLLQHQNKGNGSGGRGLRGSRVSVRGVVSAVCPVLDIRGTEFFIFALRQNSSDVNVIVKDSSLRLWWAAGVHVGMNIHVTELRACTLRSWSGNSVLSVTDQSELDVIQTSQSEAGNVQAGHSESRSVQTSQSEPKQLLTGQSGRSNFQTGQSESDTSQTGQLEPGTVQTGQSKPGIVQTSQSELSNVRTAQSEASVRQTDQSQLCFDEPENMDQSEALDDNRSELKQCPVINYQGVVTEILCRGVGLYVMDKKVGLCLANQPLPRRRLRPGDVIQVSNVHVLRRPSPDHSPIMLCCCLRSSVTVRAFSPGYQEDRKEENRCPGDGALLRLLLEKDVGVAEYLWMCHVTSALQDSLSSSEQQCICFLSWKILQSVSLKPHRSVLRNIYKEMMDSDHTCRITQVGSAPSPLHMLSRVSSLKSHLHSLCWSSLNLHSLLPPDGQSLNCSQLNAALSWSKLCLQSDCGDQGLDQREARDLQLGTRPLLVVGLLELPTEDSETQTLHLRDSTGTLPCVITELNKDMSPNRDQGPDQEKPGQEQSAVFNTAWIGCLVCVRSFTMVAERFIQSEFPSYRHLNQQHFITSKDCRVYLQFSITQVTILSPSVSMTIHLCQGAGPDDDHSNEEAESEERKTKKQKTLDGEAEVVGGARACVSMVIQVEQKEGVARRNVGAGSELSFVLKAAAIGPAVIWGRDPKNEPITEKEVRPGGEKVLSLLFCGAPCRWFPVLQPGRFYRIVALDTQDPSVLIGSAVTGQTGVELHTDSALQVRSDWRIHTVTRPLSVKSESCELGSLSDVINNSKSDLVSFQALVLERVGVVDRSRDSAHSGVRLTVCDPSGRSLQVYLDLSHAPFTPGLLPGNTVSFSRVQKKVSRSGFIYCSSVSVSCVSVVSIALTSAPALPPFPMMLLGQWSREGGVSVARVKGHLVCFLFLQLQWSCSQCDRVYTRRCSDPGCSSASSVFKAKARAVLEDGSAESHVTFYDPLVQTLLGLDDAQWAGLQRALKVKGHVQVQPRGRGLSVESPGSDRDPLQSLLLCCCQQALIGSLSLTVRIQRSTQSTGTEMKRIIRGDRDFMTQMPRPLQLTCVHLERL